MSEAKHTPGPWRWEVNLKARRIQLCGGDPKSGFGKYDHTVMDFVRWGTSGAQPRFLGDRDGHPTLLETADQFAVPVEGREHHATWFQGLSQPNANLIAAAPDLLEALKYVLTAHGEQLTDAFEQAHKAIAKAEQP